jgi:virulence-associated protein VagC
MSRTEEAVTQVRHQQGEESLIIPDGFRLDTERAIIRQEGERLVVIPLNEPPAGDRHAHHAPKPRPDQGTAMPLTPTPPMFEVIGGPYAPRRQWGARLRRLWAWASPAPKRDRIWLAGYAAGQSVEAGKTQALRRPAPRPEPAARREPAAIAPASQPQPFPWLERFKARLQAGERMASPDADGENPYRLPTRDA